MKFVATQLAASYPRTVRAQQHDPTLALKKMNIKCSGRFNMKIALSIVIISCFISRESTQAQTDFWQQTAGPSDCEFACQVVCLVTTPSGDVLAGSYGELCKSTDKGNHWTRVLASTPQYANLIALKSPNYIFVICGPELWSSSNGGSNWSLIKVFPDTNDTEI
jgi:hypothetical protein